MQGLNLSLKVFLAPLVGVAVAWLASKGLQLTPEQTDALTAVLATTLTGLAHVLHQQKLARVPMTPVKPAQE